MSQKRPWITTRGKRLVMEESMFLYIVATLILTTAYATWKKMSEPCDYFEFEKISNRWYHWGKVRITSILHEYDERQYKGPFPRGQRFVNLFVLRPLVLGLFSLLLILVFIFPGLLVDLYWLVKAFLDDRRDETHRKEIQKRNAELERITLKFTYNCVNGVLAVTTREAYNLGWSRRIEAIRHGYGSEKDLIHVDPVCLFFQEGKHKVGEEDLTKSFTGRTEDFERKCQEVEAAGWRIVREKREEMYVPFSSPKQRKRDASRSGVDINIATIFNQKSK